MSALGNAIVNALIAFGKWFLGGLIWLIQLFLAWQYAIMLAIIRALITAIPADFVPDMSQVMLAFRMADHWFPMHELCALIVLYVDFQIIYIGIKFVRRCVPTLG